MVPLLSNSGVPQGEVEQLVKLYRASAQRLAAIVTKPPGGTAKAQTFNQARAAEQLRQIEGILGGLKTSAADWIGHALPIAMNDGVKRATQQAVDAGVKLQGSALAGGFSLIDEGTARVFAHEIYADLSKAADSMGARASNVLRQTRQQGLNESEIDRILAGGAIEGKPRETIIALREELKAVHGQVVSITSRNGKKIDFEVGYYAELVARTKTRQATVVARHQRLQQLGMDLVAIIGKTSKNFCTAYLGQVFSLGGKSGKYPPLSSLPGGGPPFHPQCTKSTRPFVEDLATDQQLEDAQGDEDQQSMLNIDAATAQRRFQDLQLGNSARERYANTAAKLFA